MTAAQIKPTPNDRFSLTLSIAVLMHVLIVFGISFTMEDRPNTRMNMRTCFMLDNIFPLIHTFDKKNSLQFYLSAK